MIDYQTLLVPYDFSEHAEAALARALDLQKRLDADLHLLYVIPTPVYVGMGPDAQPFPVPPAKEEYRRSLRRVAVSACKEATRPIESRVVEGANVAEEIRAVAESLDADLIVMGTHGHSGLMHLLLGSVAEQTLRRAPCPVLTVRAESREEGWTGPGPTNPFERAPRGVMEPSVEIGERRPARGSTH